MGKINPAAVAVMAERGIDISGEYPKPWTGEIIAAADVIVSMGCGDRVPACAAVDTKTGTLTTRPAKTWPRCGRSATRSNVACASCSTTRGFPTGPERGRRTEDVKVDGSYRMMC